MVDFKPAPSKEELPAGTRALKMRLASARSEVATSRKTVADHLRKYPKSMQPIESMVGRAEHPEIAERLIAEMQVKQSEYDNAFEEYVQGVHEQHMKEADENNKATIRIARIMTWLTVILALAAIAQTVATCRQSMQPAQAPVVNVYPTIYVSAQPAPVLPKGQE